MAQAKLERSNQGAFTIVCNADREPERWVKERRGLITATDVPSILGVPGARDPIETWYQKKDALVARTESEAMVEARREGHGFEDSNAHMFSERTGRLVTRSQDLVRSTKHPWLGCTVDYLQRSRNNSRDIAPLETKNAGGFVAEEMWPRGGEPHLMWLVQLAVQTVALGMDWGSLSAWLGSPYVHHRHADFSTGDDLRDIILEESARFHKSLKRKTPPKLEPGPGAYEVLRRLRPGRVTGRVIKLPKDAQQLSVELHIALKLQEKHRAGQRAVDTQVENLKGRLAVLIGDNAGGKLPDGTVWTFKPVHVAAHTVAAYSYRTLNREEPTARKPRTTWKTSKRQ